jgi:ketosteroid isomerase-like protein
MGRFLALLVIAAASSGCVSSEPVQLPDPAILKAELESAMGGYLDAQARRDGVAMNAFYADSPEFEALMNGARQDLATTRDGNIAYYSGLREIQGGFTQLATTLLAPDVGLITALRDQTMTDTLGAAVRHTGGASWVWVKRQDAWRILHINSHFDQTTSD